jgi:hypothetical protein
MSPDVENDEEEMMPLDVEDKGKLEVGADELDEWSTKDVGVADETGLESNTLDCTECVDDPPECVSSKLEGLEDDGAPNVDDKISSAEDELCETCDVSEDEDCKGGSATVLVEMITNELLATEEYALEGGTDGSADWVVESSSEDDVELGSGYCDRLVEAVAGKDDVLENVVSNKLGHAERRTYKSHSPSIFQHSLS